MKALLVTSRVTFVPRNYDHLVCGMADDPHVGGLLVVDNASGRVLRRALALMAAGARGIGAALIRNQLGLSARRRRRAFAAAGKPTWTLPTVNCDDAVRLVRDHGFDVIVNARARNAYEDPILEAPKLGCINIHHGLLPDQRGTMCDLWALSLQKQAGFSIHQMVPVRDAGGILSKVVVSDGSDRHYPRYLKESSRRELGALRQVLSRIATEGRVSGFPNIAPRALTRFRTPSADQLGQIRRRGIRL